MWTDRLVPLGACVESSRERTSGRRRTLAALPEQREVPLLHRARHLVGGVLRHPNALLPRRSTRAFRMTFLPGSRTCSNAALFSSTQLPEGEFTSTVVDLLLSRSVAFSCVPAGNWLLDAAGAPPAPDSFSVDLAQTAWPAWRRPVPLQPTACCCCLILELVHRLGAGFYSRFLGLPEDTHVGGRTARLWSGGGASGQDRAGGGVRLSTASVLPRLRRVARSGWLTSMAWMFSCCRNRASADP